MRRQVKRQLIELLDTMQEALGLLLAAVQEGNLNDLPALLADQQEAAVAVGNEIETSEGEGTKAVSLLELYCEILWRMSQAQDGDIIRSGVEELRRVLQQTKQALQDLPEPLEVVFLPYKASMWDCMESVWEAACADSGCHATVMPIPYFDIKDGQVTARHYEGDKFPTYVPVEDYRNISLEDLRPDMIFVHNAFDDFNKVTSVLPQFYSRKLREVTKRLIYIPYYVTGEAVYVTHRYIPSYDNMDFIVTQCEKMIASYAASIPKKKFLPFGSPIADRIIKLEREKPVIPEEWKCMLPNGTDFGGCRTVMLNTSISILMKEKDRFLNKIEYIFDVVKEMQGVLLIWRPHPLLHTSAAALGDKYARRLEQLEKRFVEEKIGVLDKNPDVGVTVALCDAYLGETASSLIHMFGIAGKPRFYINSQIPRVSDVGEEIAYTVTGSCEEEGKEYLLLDAPGWVVERSVTSGEISPLFKIPSREYIPGRAYHGMELREGKLWLYPDNAQGALVYDIETGRMQKNFDEAVLQKNAKNVTIERENSAAEGTVVLTGNSPCEKAIKAERFLRGNIGREWYEGDRYQLEDYFSFLLTAEEKDLAGNTGMYSVWLASLDGSCGRKVLQAVKESLSEGM